MSKERINWSTDVITFETIRFPKYREVKSGWLDSNVLSAILFGLLWGAMILFACNPPERASGKLQRAPHHTTPMERR